MKVFLILPEYPPSFGGMQTHAVYLTRLLHSKGYEIEVATYRSLQRSVRRTAAAYDREQPFATHRVLSRTGYWSSVRRLAALVRRFKPDLVYSSTIFYGLLAEMTGVPVVCRSVGNDVLRCWIGYPFRAFSGLAATTPVEKALNFVNDSMKNPLLVREMFRKSRQELAVANARAASRILANSAYTAGLLRAIGVPASRMEILVGGVDYERFAAGRGRAQGQAARAEFGLPQDAFVMSTACRLVEKKGLDFLLAALATLDPGKVDFRLLIAGEGKGRKTLVRLARALGIAHRVSFLGTVPHEEMQRVYAASDAFVLASREHVLPNGQKDVETMGRVLCEANAAGVPVVAANSGGIPSVIEHGLNGLLFDEEDAAGMLAALEAIRVRRVDVKALVKAGRAAARERFDWSVIMRRHEEVFARVVKSRRARRAAPPAAALAVAAKA